jgi:hypothetical protein
VDWLPSLPAESFIRIPRQKLPGLCAFACAEHFDKLAEKILESYSEQRGYARWGTVGIFEGEPTGFDPDGNPLFHPRKLVLLIAERYEV